MKIWTAGHSNRGTEELVELLRRAGIELLVDVRRYPGSRRHPHFASRRLAASLDSAGIDYAHEEDLGGHRDPRPGSPHTGIREDAFRGYADHMDSPEFARALARLVAAAAERRTAVMCAERDWRGCHRSLLSDRLVVEGIEVVHLLGDGEEKHALRPPAAVEGNRLVYRGAVQRRLWE